MQFSIAFQQFFFSSTLWLDVWLIFDGVDTKLHVHVVRGLCFIFWSLLILTLFVIVSAGITALLIAAHPIKDASVTVLLLSVVSTIVFIPFPYIISGYIAFSANVIQYGMDQLHDVPTDDSVLYIHWYVWITYLAALLMNMSNFYCQVTFFSNQTISTFCLLFLRILYPRVF